MRDKFDIMCELQDEAHELHKLASIETKKLRSLEKKYFDEIITNIVESDNLEKAKEFIEYLRTIKLVPYSMTFLFMLEYRIEKEHQEVTPKEVEIDYSIFTDDVIEELRKQTKIKSEAWDKQGEVQDKASKAYKEYKKSKDEKTL